MGDNKSLYVYNFCNGCFIATDPHIKVDIIDYWDYWLTTDFTNVQVTKTDSTQVTTWSTNILSVPLTSDTFSIMSPCLPPTIIININIISW